MREELRKFIKETGLAPLTALKVMKEAQWDYEKALELSKEYTKWLN